MKTKMRKLLALLLTLAMVLPMVVGIVPVSAEEAVTVEEIPTVTLPADTGSTDEDIPIIQQWKFNSETDLEDFDLYQSEGSKFVINNGVLQPDGADGEQKAILNKDIQNIKTVSVNIMPNDNGTIYGGILIGARDAANGQDQVNAMTVLVQSDFTGWSDAPNRIDLILGEFHYGWTMHELTVSESGLGNNLFSGGVKQPLNLKVAIGYDTLLVTLSLANNPGKYLQRFYQVDHAKLQGQVGLRSLGSATKYDDFTINEDYLPKNLIQGLQFDGTGTTSYVKTSAGMSAKPVTTEVWFKMDQLPSGSQRQALISNYHDGSLASQKKGGWGIYTTESGMLYYTEKSSNGEFNKTLGVNIWQNDWIHLALVRRTGVLDVYINGILANSVASAVIGESYSLTNPLTFGYCGVGGSTGRNAMSGVIGDVRMWSIERTAQQIQDTMYKDLTNTEEGLIHHWDFDEQCASGVIDHVGNLPGTVIGAKWTNPKADTNVFSGVQLDGTLKDSYVMSSQTVAQKPVTIEAWVNMDALTSGSRRQAIISNYVDGTLASQSKGTWGLYTTESGQLYYTEKSSTGEFNQGLGYNLWNGAWTHVALVRSAGVLHVYINGSLIGSVTNAAVGDTLCQSNYLTIGYCGVGGATNINSLQGEIGDIRLWSTERTAEQIKANMYADLTGTEEGLTHHWDFDSQKYGVVSNSVSGSTNCDLLGHTRIGNEEIRCWDFSQESQMEDFTPELGYGSYSVTGGKLYVAANSWFKMGNVEQIENITSVSMDVTHGAKANVVGGLFFGIKATEFFQTSLIRQRTSSSKNPWSEISIQDSAGTVLANATNESFFPGANVKVDFCMQLDMEGDTITAQMYRLDDPTIVNKASYALGAERIAGQVGMWTHTYETYFDNFTIVSKVPETVEVVPDQPPVQEDTVLYENEGYIFSNESRPWKLTKDLTEMPYTVETWVKIPEGVSNSVSGYILTNINRAPYISLEMLPGGKLRLGLGTENEGLSIVRKGYDVDVDLRTSKWTHIAYTMDAASDRVVAYINGEVAGTWDNADLPEISFPDNIYPSNLITIGSYSYWALGRDVIAYNPLAGWIADVRMWNKPLSAEEIKDSMMTQYTQPREGLIVNLPLNEKVNDAFLDLAGNGYDATIYSASLTLEEETHEPGSYSMVVIPDQQILNNHYPNKLYNMYQWIIDNREKENIQVVMNVGDMADISGRRDQWERVRAAVDMLPDDLPFITVPGNHDYDTNSGWNKGYGIREQLTLMNEFLPRSLFESYPTEIGFFDEVNSANQWQAFTVNGHPYLIIAVEYVPQDDVIAWANEVVEAHPDHQVIMITHSFVGNYGELHVPKLWSDFLSKHENVIMSFSGHVQSGSAVCRTDKGVNGNTVYNTLMDAQFADGIEGGLGMIGILRFNADGTLCNLSYYSTDRDMYNADSNLTLEISKPKTMTAQVGEKMYESVAEAAANANGEVVEIMMDTDEMISISSDVTIDLAGCKLSSVTVAEGATLTLIDTATDDYKGAYGTATVTGAVNTFAEVDGKDYMVVSENGEFSAHCYDVAITHISLKPVNDALGYKAQVYGDEVVQSHVKSLGFNMWVDGGKTKTFEKAASSVTLRLQNILACNGGEININATAFVTLEVGEQTTTKTGIQQTTTMKETLQMVNSAWADYSEAQQEAVKTLCDKYVETVSDWELTNIYPVAEEVLPETEETTAA